MPTVFRVSSPTTPAGVADTLYSFAIKMAHLPPVYFKNFKSLDKQHTAFVKWEKDYRKLSGPASYDEIYYPNYFIAAEVKKCGYKHLAANYTNLTNELGPQGTFYEGLHNSLVIKPSQQVPWRQKKDDFIRFMFHSNVKPYVRDLLIRDLNKRYKALVLRNLLLKKTNYRHK